MFSGSCSRYDNQDSNPAPTNGGHLRSRIQEEAHMGTSALCDAGSHQPVVALDCFYPVPARQYVVLNHLEVADFIKQYINKLILY